jgi:hypothetical protein
VSTPPSIDYITSALYEAAEGLPRSRWEDFALDPVSTPDPYAAYFSIRAGGKRFLVNIEEEE